MFEPPFHKVADLRACNFIKKEAPTQVLSCEYWKIFDNNYYEEHLRPAAFETWSNILEKFCDVYTIRFLMTIFQHHI